MGGWSTFCWLNTESLKNKKLKSIYERQGIDIALTLTGRGDTTLDAVTGASFPQAKTVRIMRGRCIVPLGKWKL